MPNPVDHGEQPQRVCCYKFEDFQAANLVARNLTRMAAEDVKVTRSSADEFRVSFKGAWEIEQQLIKKVPEHAGSFRSDSPYSKEEEALIREMYLCWYDAIEIEKTVRRSRSVLAERLEAEGLLISFADRGFEYDWDELVGAWEDEFSPTDGFSDVLVGMLQKMGVLKESIQQFSQRQIPPRLPLSALSAREIDNVFSLLCDAGRWDEAKRLALARGDRISAACWSRREMGDTYPLEFLEILADSEGLPMHILYQRELARAYQAWNLINGYPKCVAQWANAAKARERDYHVQGPLPPPLKHPDLPSDDAIVSALAAIGNEKALERLAKETNRLAAAILADMHRLQMKKSDYPLDAADQWAAIQDDYWPTENEIHTILAANIKYDREYAKKMERLGVTYWGFRRDKSYSVQW